MSFVLQLPRRFHDEMVDQARAELPNECCGLLAGELRPGEAGVPVGRVVRRFPLVNAAASPVRFDADPRGLFLAFKEMRRDGLELLAIYHSHPVTDPVPSRTDLERSYSPDVMSLIISLRDSVPVVRAWWLSESGYAEARWDCVEDG